MAQRPIPNSEPDYPWYQNASGDNLYQGDLLFEFAVPLLQSLPKPGEQSHATAAVVNVVIMTQSCDLEENKVSTVLLCPFLSLQDFVTSWIQKTKWPKEKACTELRKGNLPGYHLIQAERDANPALPFSVVDFHQIHTAAIQAVRHFASQVPVRLRMLSPYREQLAQAFARFFMRVGLPVDIDEREMVRSLKS
jgi:hypothetical protein